MLDKLTLDIYDRIRNRRLQFFNGFNLTLGYDRLAGTFKFDYYFDPDNPEHKELSCIGHYHQATVRYNDQVLLTGTILSINMPSGPVKQLVPISGYSLPGVFEDCNIPPDMNLQSDSLSLRNIAQQLCKRFGLTMQVDAAVSKDMDTVFDTTKAGDTQTIKGFLTELAVQKNIVLSHTPQGAVLFTRANTTQAPVLSINTANGSLPGTSINLSFNGQAMHSHITVMKQADVEAGNMEPVTIRNPYVYPAAVYRPKVIVQSSGTDVDSNLVAKQALAAELKNLQLTVTTDRWLVNNRLLTPNSIIEVTSPENYLYNTTRWFVEEVSYTGTAEKTTATLKCVLPEVYNGQTPQYLFKGINLH